MYLDGKLTLRNHVEKTVEETKKKLQRLAGRKWGSSRSVLNATRAGLRGGSCLGCQLIRGAPTE
jgi:hypothetical protein